MADWWDILTSPGGPRGTRASVRQAFRQNLARSSNRVNLERRIDAAAQALALRYRVTGHPQTFNVTLLEAIPFGYMSDEKAAEVLAEYVVYQEHPADCRRQWVHDEIWQALEQFFSDSVEPGRSIGQSFVDNIRSVHGQFLWSNWIGLTAFESTARDGSPLVSDERSGLLRAESEQAESAEAVSNIRRLLADIDGAAKRSIPDDISLKHFRDSRFYLAYLYYFFEVIVRLRSLHVASVARDMAFQERWGEDREYRCDQLNLFRNNDDPQVLMAGRAAMSDSERYFRAIQSDQSIDGVFSDLDAALSKDLVNFEESY